MISDRNLNRLISKTREISELVQKHRLDDIALLQPLKQEEERALRFLISKKGLSFENIAAIKLSLCSLLDIDCFSDHIVIKDKELFKEGYFEREYGEKLSFSRSVSETEATAFIKNKLKFEYTASPTVSQKTKKESKPVPSWPIPHQKGSVNGSIEKLLTTDTADQQESGTSHYVSKTLPVTTYTSQTRHSTKDYEKQLKQPLQKAVRSSKINGTLFSSKKRKQAEKSNGCSLPTNKKKEARYS